MDTPQQYAERLIRMSEDYTAKAQALEKELVELYQKSLAARSQGPAPPRDFGQVQDLAEALKQLEAAHRAPAGGGQPAVTDETRKIDERIAEVAKRLNKLYADWAMNLRLVAPPSQVPAGFFEKWLAQPGKKEMKAFIVRCVDQKGLPVTERVTIKKVEGGYGPKLELRW